MPSIKNKDFPYKEMNISDVGEFERSREEGSPPTMYTNIPTYKGQPNTVFLKDMPQEPDTDLDVYSKWQGFRKHLIDTKFGGDDPDAFDPMNEAKKAREQYILNAAKSYGRDVSPQVAKIIFTGADKYATDIVKQKKYKVDSSRNELARMLDWFKEREKPKEQKFITGVDASGKPVRVPDVTGAQVYEKPTAITPTFFERNPQAWRKQKELEAQIADRKPDTSLTQLDKYIGQYDKEITRLRTFINGLADDDENRKKYLGLLNENKEKKAKTLRLKGRLLNKEITSEQINWLGNTQKSQSPLLKTTSGYAPGLKPIPKNIIEQIRKKTKTRQEAEQMAKQMGYDPSRTE